MLRATADWIYSVINYELQTVNITYNTFSGTVRALDLPHMDTHCTFDSAHCYDGLNTVIWNIPNADHTCDLVKHSASDCYLSITKLVCPSLALSVSDYAAAVNDDCGAI